ncbi:MAG: acyl carrier protein [Tateyamaria sp.]|uniref:acyl carrier protein n=1 Tax=Tateyamaria sp. TaxID=1929288 RepID=UPI00327FD59A
MTEIEQKISQFMQDTFGVAVVTANTSLVSEGYIDSMQVLEVAMFLETEFGLALDEADLIVENFDTLSAMSSLVSARG